MGTSDSLLTGLAKNKNVDMVHHILADDCNQITYAVDVTMIGSILLSRTSFPHLNN